MKKKYIKETYQKERNEKKERENPPLKQTSKRREKEGMRQKKGECAVNFPV